MSGFASSSTSSTNTSFSVSSVFSVVKKINHRVVSLNWIVQPHLPASEKQVGGQAGSSQRYTEKVAGRDIACLPTSAAGVPVLPVKSEADQAFLLVGGGYPAHPY